VIEVVATLGLSIGPNLTWHEITLESTDEPITTGIVRKLPRLPAYYSGMLDGAPYRDKNTLANTLRAAAGDAFEQVPVTGTLRADDSEPLRDAAVAGVGVALLPTWLVGEDIKAGRLPHGLPEWSSMIATSRAASSGSFLRIAWCHRRCGPFWVLPRNDWDPDWTKDRHQTSHNITE
jgi:DNA-binding transcriptional LysR family regulator